MIKNNQDILAEAVPEDRPFWEVALYLKKISKITKWNNLKNYLKN